MLPELPVPLNLSLPSGIQIDEMLSVTVILVSVILLIVSMVSFRKTGLQRMLLISGAFGLFAVKSLFEHFGVWVLSWSAQTEEAASLGLDLVILLLFFLALYTRR